MPQASKAPRIGVILAGGAGRRMGGADKGALMLGGQRLIDHVLRRIGPQVDRVLICGRHDYGTGLPVVKDRDDGPRGPAAGLWAALCWIGKNEPEADGFLTAPADGPFFPSDLYNRLAQSGATAVACDADGGAHPTFAYWNCDRLQRALRAATAGHGLALKDLADSVHANRVIIGDQNVFFNINTPDDLERARSLLDV